MNRIKTFFFYIGTLILCNIGIAFFLYLSNKIFDNLSDVFFVPTKAALMGYVPFYISAAVALNTTNKFERTLKILWRWKFLIAIIYTIYGLLQLVVGLYYNFPLFEFTEEIKIFSIPDHWLYSLPMGITGLIAAFHIKNGIDLIGLLEEF